jgi:osmotically-inducible protein OsmY
MKTDQDIQKDVMAELKWVPFLKSTDIGVAVHNGVVTLSGTVDSCRKKTEAEKAARRIAGVKAVAEDIEVKPNAFGRRNDTQVAEAVLNALKWDSQVVADKITVKVEDGWVTLDGEVDWHYQRKAANDTVLGLHGVKGINNNITIKPSLNVNEIKHEISAAFHRSANVDSKKVKVDVEGTHVTLSGTVRSYLEKKEAEQAAWRAPGVATVENKILIDEAVFAY